MKKLWIKNKATHWLEDGSLAVAWCVMRGVDRVSNYTRSRSHAIAELIRLNRESKGLVMEQGHRRRFEAA